MESYHDEKVLMILVINVIKQIEYIAKNPKPSDMELAKIYYIVLSILPLKFGKPNQKVGALGDFIDDGLTQK